MKKSLTLSLIMLLTACMAFPQQWTYKSSHPSTPQGEIIRRFSFGIGNKLYTGGGLKIVGGVMQKDFWEYDILTSQWVRKADVPDNGRTDAIAFVIGNKGYMGLGRNIQGAFTQDIWEYDPSTNVWTRKGDFPGGPRAEATSFVLNGKMYLFGGGWNQGRRVLLFST